MIQALFGDRGNVDLKQYVGQVITVINVDDVDLTLTFANGKKLTFHDGGQSCCEHRYMTCDDDLPYYIGATFVDADLADGPEVEDGEWGDVHEQQFLNIYTDRGKFQIANHNQHNGYYGGFWIQMREE